MPYIPRARDITITYDTLSEWEKLASSEPTLLVLAKFKFGDLIFFSAIGTHTLIWIDEFLIWQLIYQIRQIIKLKTCQSFRYRVLYIMYLV